MEKITDTLVTLEDAIKNTDENKAINILEELKKSVGNAVNEENINEIKSRLEEILKEVKLQAKEHPLFAIAVTGIIGFLLGRLSK